MMAAVGKPKAKVQILTDPLLGSVTAAMSWSNLEEIFDRYGMVNLFLLIVDRDLDSNRRIALDNLEKRAENRCVLLAENAWQEIEVWALAAQDLPRKWKWADVRSEQHPKEVYFEPFALSRGLQDEPGLQSRHDWLTITITAPAIRNSPGMLSQGSRSTRISNRPSRDDTPKSRFIGLPSS